MAEQDIPRIELAVINLYPFESVTSKPDCRFEDAIENIDIGGPAMVRSAAKNFDAVAIVTSPDQYENVLEKLQSGAGKLDQVTRYELAVAAFNRVAQYDDAISNYLSARTPEGEVTAFPGQANACFIKVADLRYGENPHQQAAWYRDLYPAKGSLASANQHQGKELSYNNIADADAAWECVRQFDGHGMRHHQARQSLRRGHRRQRQRSLRPGLRYGPHVSFWRHHRIQPPAGCGHGRKYYRPAVPRSPDCTGLRAGSTGGAGGEKECSRAGNCRRIAGEATGVQAHRQRTADPDVRPESADPGRLPRGLAKDSRTNSNGSDLMFAWKVARMVKSNAIVYASGGRTVGVGAGQMSRVDSARIGRWKAEDAGLPINGAVMASDAFFPFPGRHRHRR